MAETTVFPGGTQVAPPIIEEKKPVGRPRKDGQPAGTPPLALSSEPEDFFLMLPAITPDEWQFRMLYLYRLYPITDRRGAGQPVYLNKFSEVIDRDRIMRDYGSGIYKLELLQTIPNERGKKIAACLFQILNQDYPPKVPAGEWVNDPRNADWEWCRPKLGPGSIAAGGSASPDDIANAVYAKVHQNEPKDQTPGMLAVLAPLLDPKRQTDMLASFATMMKPKEDTTVTTLLLPLLIKMLDKPSGPDPMMQMLMDDRKSMREEMAEMRRNAAATPQKDMLDSLLENREKFEALKGLFGKGNSGPAAPEGWAGVADKFVDRIGGALQTIAPVIAQRMMMPPPGQPNTQPQQPPRTLIQTTAQPLPPAPAPAEQPVQQQPQQQTPATPQPEAAPVPTTEQQQKAMDIWNKYGNAIMQALPFMIDKFQEEFPDGYDCRDWFCSPKRFGNVMWHGLKTEVGIDGFVQIAKQFPDVWMKFQPEDKFREFMADFFTPLGEERPDDFDDEDGEDDPAESTSAADSRAPQKASVK